MNDRITPRPRSQRKGPQSDLKRRRGPRPASRKPSSAREDNSTLPMDVDEPDVIDGPGLSRTTDVPTDTPRFADLGGRNLVHPLLLKAITDDMKFNHMMPVQAATLEELLPPNQSDCLVQAKTGTGKTIAFLLPALQTMITQKRKNGTAISLLVISPTRELAIQIAQEAESLLQRLPNYRVCTAIGGTNKDKEERQILKGCDVLIATPGRLIDHLTSEEIVYAFRSLNTLVLDEADRLLDMGFMPSLREIVQKLPDRKEVNRQGMLFSATIAPHVSRVAGLILSPEHKFISTIAEGDTNTHERVPQFLIKVPTFSDVAPAMVGAIKDEAARHDNFKSIVFAPTAAQADFYGEILVNISGLPHTSILHSRMSQTKRVRITNEYRDAKAAILVATDVIARGMDFPGVTTVFQVGIPSEKQSYIHRLGRTARADAEGRGIFLICEAESFFPQWTLKQIKFIPQAADLSSAKAVEGIVDSIGEEDKQQTYKAWLGFYNNHLRSFKWDKEELVRQANKFAREGLGCPETPPIMKTTVRKMGLRGVKGLNVVPDDARPKRPLPRGSGPKDISK